VREVEIKNRIARRVEEGIKSRIKKEKVVSLLTSFTVQESTISETSGSVIEDSAIFVAM
jgi:hypothetical protein